jgi:HEAT repeat protein
LPAGAVDLLAKRLDTDPWTFVRAHAAEALAVAPPGEPANRPLGQALADSSPRVRARAIEALGRRGARTYADAVAARLEDDKEDADVRTRAAQALGRFCDRRFVDRLTEAARRGASPTAPAATQAVAASAAAALGQLNPPDLGARIAPLVRREAPALIQEAGKSALEAVERCPR